MASSDIDSSAIEAAHFETGVGEVLPPPQESTFAVPAGEPTHWIKHIVAKRMSTERVIEVVPARPAPMGERSPRVKMKLAKIMPKIKAVKEKVSETITKEE